MDNQTQLKNFGWGNKMNQTQLEAYNEGGYKIYRVPGIVCTDKGTLIAAYECRHGADWSAMDLAVRRSEDGGESWSERCIVADGQGINVLHNAILFADGDTVHMVWHRNYREAYYMYSRDEGLTWSKARDITDAYLPLRKQYNWTVIAAGPGHGLVTSKGRMIIPVWVASNIENITSHHPSVVTTLYSDDHGKTWQCGEIIWAKEDFIDPNESVLAELSDGRIMINCRHETGTGVRKVGFSPDGISGWDSFYFDEQLIDPVCCAGMTQGDGHLWFTNCACKAEEGRIRLSIRRSDDDGKTWPYIKELAGTGGYSDVFYSPSAKMLYVIAETGRATDKTFSFGISVFCLSPEEISASSDR